MMVSESELRLVKSKIWSYYESEEDKDVDGNELLSLSRDLAETPNRVISDGLQQNCEISAVSQPID
jgi:hypothetical protein